MTDTNIYSYKLDEIRIGILGFKDSGKTTFHASLAYWLYHHVDEEFRHGEPVGVQTREFIDDKIHDLITGEFPKHTTKDIQLSYRMKYKAAEYLLNIMDYDGGQTTVLHDIKNELPAKLADIENFFAQCHAYFIFISVEDLVKPESELPLEKISGIYDIIRHYHDRRAKTGKKLQIPMIVCITKSDLIDETNPKTAKMIDNVFQRFIPRLRDNVQFYDKVFISSIGNDFLDDKGRKRTDAQFQPKNILEPFRFVFEIRQKRKNKRIVIKALILIFLFISILFTAGLMLKSTANYRVQDLRTCTANIATLTDEELEIKPFEVDDLYERIGMFRALIFDDVERIKQNRLDEIKKEQNRRELQKFDSLAKDSPGKIDELSEQAHKVNGENAEKSLQILKEARKKQDEESWQKATTENTVKAYQKYITECKDFGAHVEDAQKRILGLKKKSVLQQWNEISSFIKEKPDEYETIIQNIRNFVLFCPYELRKDIKPLPDKLLDEFIEKWDKKTWASIIDYEDKFVDSDKGSFSNIETLINKFESYLTRFEHPIFEQKAKESIKFFKTISQTSTCRIILSHANYLGGVEDYEKNPDIYIKIYINDVLAFNSVDFVITDEREPRWNKEFTIDWKAYDAVKVEIWDKNLISDTEMCELVENGLTSAHDVFRNIYYPKRDAWKLRVSFEWLGPKR